jgi:hypothetical protein
MQAQFGELHYGMVTPPSTKVASRNGIPLREATQNSLPPEDSLSPDFAVPEDTELHPPDQREENNKEQNEPI